MLETLPNLYFYSNNVNKLVSAKYYLEEKDDNIIPYELDWWKFDLIVVSDKQL